VQLADAARPGIVGRQAIWRRHATRADAGGRTRARWALRLATHGADRPFRVRHGELVACLIADQRRQLHREAEQPASVRIYRGNGDRELGVRPELVDDGGTLVGPHQDPWSAGDRWGYRQLNGVTRIDDEFAV